MSLLTTHPPFQLLATAISGRSIHIIYLPQADEVAHTNFDHIFIADNQTMEQQCQQIVVQCLLVAGGSLGRKNLLSIVGKHTLRRRYLLLEVVRCAHLFEDRLPRSLCVSISRYRTDIMATSPEHSLSLAKSSIVLPEPPNWFGTIYPLKALRSQSLTGGKSLTEQELLELEDAFKSHQKSQQKDDEDSAVKDDFWQLFSSPLGRNGIISKLLSDLLNMSSSPDDKMGEGAAGSNKENISTRIVQRLRDVMSALRSPIELGDLPIYGQPSMSVFRYPEWDFSSGKYKPQWVSVEEVNAYSDDPVLEGSCVNHKHNGPYQRALAGLCFNYEQHKGQLYGDDIVLDRLVSLTAAMKSGMSGDERIYRSSLKTQRALGVQILVDVSSSTLEMSSTKQRICELHLEAAWQLCRAFYQLGDRVAMHGFHSWGRNHIRFQRIKTFDESVGDSVLERIKALSVAGYSRFGAGIRHSVDQLNRYSGMPYKLLLVISDGYPYDEQYEGPYAIEDTRKAIDEAKSQGVACVCLCIGSDVEEEKLTKIYGSAHFLALDKIESLPVRLRSVIESAISASIRVKCKK